MSLDFYLEKEGVEIFSANITHNLSNMADAAGIYETLWGPDKNGITKAIQCVEPLKNGLLELATNPEKYEKLNPQNGWGSYDGLVDSVAKILVACCKNPTADVRVWR